MSKQQQQYEQLYNKFETAFWDMFKFAEKNKKHIEGVEDSVNLIECIDEWGVEFEGCIDLAQENTKLREKLGLED